MCHVPQPHSRGTLPRGAPVEGVRNHPHPSSRRSALSPGPWWSARRSPLVSGSRLTALSHAVPPSSPPWEHLVTPASTWTAPQVLGCSEAPSHCPGLKEPREASCPPPTALEPCVPPAAMLASRRGQTPSDGLWQALCQNRL